VVPETGAEADSEAPRLSLFMRSRSCSMIMLLGSGLAATCLASGSLTAGLEDTRERPVEGTVRASAQDGGQTRSCSTTAGRCNLTGLSAGTYRLTATTLRGWTPPTRLVSIQNGGIARARLICRPPPIPTLSAVQTTTVSPNAQDSSSGKRRLDTCGQVVIIGYARDRRGEPIDGTVVIRRDGFQVERFPTQGARFEVCDLPPAKYQVTFTTYSGERATRLITVRGGLEPSRLAIR
jgi:hypothetical protein